MLLKRQLFVVQSCWLILEKIVTQSVVCHVFPENALKSLNKLENLFLFWTIDTAAAEGGEAVRVDKFVSCVLWRSVCAKHHNQEWWWWCSLIYIFYEEHIPNFFLFFLEGKVQDDCYTLRTHFPVFKLKGKEDKCIYVCIQSLHLPYIFSIQVPKQNERKVWNTFNTYGASNRIRNRTN